MYEIWVLNRLDMFPFWFYNVHATSKKNYWEKLRQDVYIKEDRQFMQNNQEKYKVQRKRGIEGKRQ